MERVATANLVSLEELLAALLERYPELRCSREVCLDHRLPPAWCQALAKWSRLDEAQIHALDLWRWFPGRDLSWFSRRWDLSGKPDRAEGSPWWTAAKFCLRCVHQQVRARFPVHRRPEWAPAFVTHCPEHFGEPLRQHCLCCYRQDPGWMIVARGRHGAEVHCRYCAVALHHCSRGKPAPLSASLQVTLQLESTLIECLRGQPPDSFWVGPVDAEDFVSLAADLLAMLTRRDSQDALTLADHLAAADWWDDHVLGYQAVTALERQEHVISRLKIVAALTKCLLGPRAFEFFRFHSAGCLGRKSLYPFSILFRELSPEQKSRLLKRAQHWPEPMAKQVARAARAAERFRGRSNGFFAKMDRNLAAKMRFSPTI